jgi:diguanylate cyclase (GGDEF)-like protein
MAHARTQVMARHVDIESFCVMWRGERQYSFCRLLMSPTPSPSSLPNAHDKGQEAADLPLPYHRQCVMDLADRMRTGLLLYPVVWMLVMQVDGYMGRHPYFVGIHGTCFVLCAIGRSTYNRRLPRMLDEDFTRTRQIFRALSLGQNLYWGVLCAMVMMAPDAPSMRWLMLLCTVGIMTGGTVIVAIDAFLPASMPPALIGPTALALFPLGGEENYAISGASVLFLAYSWNISRLVQREYWGRQHNHALLEQHARELMAISRTDALTKVPNRLHFQEGLAQAWGQALHRQEPLALAMVDLDHFKKINDVHGHPFGDRCLQAAATAISQAVFKPGDLVARFGGEEFVILMPNTDLAGAHAVAQRVLKQVRATLVTQDEHAGSLSCSIGVAAYIPSPRDGAEQLVQDADQALYVAKHHGRARVECHAPPGAPVLIPPEPTQSQHLH